jgi:hypothetical protein
MPYVMRSRAEERALEEEAERVYNTALARGRASFDNPKDPKDVPPAKKPDGGDDKKTKSTKKKSKKAKAAMLTHAEKMLAWPAYRRAFNAAVAIEDPSRPMSGKTRNRLAARGNVDPYSAAGIMGSHASGEPKNGGDIRRLGDEDRISVAGGFDGKEGLLSARAALGIATAPGVFRSTMPASIRGDKPPQTLVQAQHERDEAKRQAGAK